MRFLAGEQLHDAVRTALQGTDVRCAVAFWGNGAEADDFIANAGTAEIVCNLSMGGTNPRVIRALLGRGAKVRQHDQLHAKVYLGPTTAVVTSANASANGLALEGLEQAHWSEAGIEISRSEAADVIAWLDKIWSQSRKITDQDLRRAEALWKRRRSVKPTLSFGEYDVEAEAKDGTLPITCWWVWNGGYEADIQLAEEAVGFYRDNMFAVEIEDEADLGVIQPGNWLFYWKRTASGKPGRDKLTFGRVGRYVPGVMRSKDGERPNIGAMLAVDDPGPEPFDPTEPRFDQAFREVLIRPRFDAFRTDNGPPWFHDIDRELTNFWRQVKQRYLELAST